MGRNNKHGHVNRTADNCKTVQVTQKLLFEDSHTEKPAVCIPECLQGLLEYSLHGEASNRGSILPLALFVNRLLESPAGYVQGIADSLTLNRVNAELQTVAYQHRYPH